MINKKDLENIKNCADLAIEIEAFLKLLRAASDGVTLNSISPLVETYREKASHLAYTAMDLEMELEPVLEE